MNFSKAALVLAGHGSTVNADSSAPTHLHGAEIRRRKIFAEVHECFWKEEPNFRSVLAQVESETIYIVPNFISSGYFTEQVLPREFELEGTVTRCEGKTIYYSEPVGLHESMTEVLLHRAESVVRDSGVPLQDLKKTCLFIFGHGTTLNENSTKVIEEQVQRIRSTGRYGDCQSAYMEESPLIKDWRTFTDLLEIVAVPFFIADGLHSYEDIPVLLGLTESGQPLKSKNPHSISGRKIWYANAIGTESMMADVILAQVQKIHEANPLS